MINPKYPKYDITTNGRGAGLTGGIQEDALVRARLLVPALGISLGASRLSRFSLLLLR